MKIFVHSGDFQEVIDIPTDDRERAHLMGCIAAVKSGKVLDQRIRTSIHLDCQQPWNEQPDDIYMNTVPLMLEIMKGEKEYGDGSR